jgi:basic membrane protein A
MALLLFLMTSAVANVTAVWAAKPLKVALILPGRIDDVSWNQAMYEGLMKVKREMGDALQVKVTEEVYNVADTEPALRDFASLGYDLVIGHGFQFQETMMKVAPQFPKVKFALASGFKLKPNVAIYDVNLQEGGYIMGILAGLLTKSDKVGVLGGVDVAEIHRGHAGFKHGVKSINPCIQVMELFTGDWRDAAKAKEGAISMYESGADIIWHSGDGIGLGVVEAAKEKNRLVLGNVADQHKLAPDNVLSCVIYKWDSVIRNMVRDIKSGKYGNNKYWITFANKGISISPFRNLSGRLSASAKGKVEEALRQLAAMKVMFPKEKKK